MVTGAYKDSGRWRDAVSLSYGPDGSAFEWSGPSARRKPAVSRSCERTIREPMPVMPYCDRVNL